MKKNGLLLAVFAAVTMISGCATAPISERALGEKFPVAKDEIGEGLAQIIFSADKKYETTKGVPLSGDPLICKKEGIFRINDESSRTDQIKVSAGKELAVTSVIQWENTGWGKTCWPFVAFTPERGAKYVVVNERIGGKGFSMMWTGVAFQSCAVSVYKESPTGIERVDTRTSSVNTCRSIKQ